MLAIVESGAAFCFIDPSAPAPYAKRIIDQILPPFYLASQSTWKLWPDVLDTRTVIIVDKESIDALQVSLETRRAQLQPKDPLYVSFESSNSETPVGVVMENDAFCAAASAQSKALSIEPSTKVLQSASSTSHLFLLESLVALCAGATVCVPSQRDKAKGVGWSLKQYGASWASLPGSVAEKLTPEDAKSLKTLVLADTVLSRAHLPQWLESDVKVLNIYGLAETGGVALHKIRTTQTDPSNLGFGLASKTWVVSERDVDQLCPIGVPGQLLIEG